MGKKVELKSFLKLIIILCGILVVIVIILYIDLNRSSLVSDSKLARIKTSHEWDTSIIPEAILIDGQPLLYDKYSRMYYYSYSGDIDVGSLWNPELSVSGTLLDGDDSEKLNICMPGYSINSDFLASNGVLEICFYTESRYCTVPFHLSTLSFVSISTEGEISVGEDTPMNLYLWDNEKSNSKRTVEAEGLIHKRGATSLNFPKVGYRFTLLNENGNDDRNLLGLRKDDDWILYPAYNDAEKVRNVFSSNIWMESCAQNNEWNIDAGMEYRYVELFINDEYRGLYALGYPVDNKQLNISEGEYLYKSKRLSFSYSRLNFDEEGNERISGPVDGFELRGSLSDSEDPNSWEPFREYAKKLFDYKNLTDDELLQLVDIDNAIDVWLYINLVQGVDQGSKEDGDIYNFFIASKRAVGNPDINKVIFIPWDMDMSWGNDWDKNPDTEWGNNLTAQYLRQAEYNKVLDPNIVTIFLQRKNEYVWEKVFNRYADLRAGKWSEKALQGMLDEYEKAIFESGAYIRDIEKWPDSSHVPAEQRLDKFREFVNLRLVALDDYMNRLYKVKNYGQFVQRMVSYSDLENAKIIIEINDSAVLEDSEVVELFDYIGIDRKHLKDNDNLILMDNSANSSQSEQVNISNETSIDTCLGTISYSRLDHWYVNEESLSLMLNGIEINKACDPNNLLPIRISLSFGDDVWTEFHMSNFYKYHYGE